MLLSRNVLFVDRRLMNASPLFQRAFAISVLLLASCASQIKVDPVLLENQERIYRDGVPAVISRKGLVVVAAPVKVIREGKEQPKFIVSVANTSSSQFDIDTSNVVASVDGLPLKVFTHEEVADDIKSQQAWAAFAVAFSGGMEAASARQQASTSYNYNANSTGTYTGWTYNAAAGQAAADAVNSRTNSQLALLQHEGQAALDDAQRDILKRTTVLPGTSHGGQIFLATFEVPESGSTLDLKVSVAGEDHQFRFTNQRYKK
jgi:predicted MPP superfamily phosphohydrolase